MKRTFKYYLKLNKVQKQKLDHILELCCWLHNYLLEQFRTRDKNGEKQPTEFQLINSLPEVKKQHPFLKEVHSSNLQEVAKLVHKRWQKYEELKKLDKKKGYPKFKPIHRHNSFYYSISIERSGCGYKIDNSPLSKKKEVRKLKLTLGNQNNHRVYLELKMTMERNFQEEVKNLTIKRKNNRYYALFSCSNVAPKLLPRTNKKVGLDLGVRTLITTSEGDRIKNPRFYKKSGRIIKEAQRRLSRKVKDSKNWKKAKFQLAKKWEKLTNQAKYYSRQVANNLVKKHDSIAVEDLNVKSMLKKKLGDGKRSLRRSLLEVKFGILLKVIAEAAEIATRQFVPVESKNTSQICSDCGELLKDKLELNQRTFECWNCKLELDRDVNSARNILNRAILENRFDQNLPLNKENIY